ncbi:glycosyltransferase family 2 protein [Halobacterium yunchengense]|uniref:glycosyltransferase family 2 protein n=1 Tax=Halobacterium yunchengense TaxID=3108497 RepID=UPI003008029F
MYRGRTVAVVVPAHDEAAFVGDVVEAVPGFVDRVYVVDDASGDDTAAAALAAADESPSARQVDCVDSETGSVDTEAGSVDTEAGSVDTEAGSVDTEAGSVDTEAGSVDAERALAVRVAESTPSGRVVVLRHDENRGAGGAVTTGYLAALADGVDLVATVDGDGQMDPSRLDRFLDPLVDGEADYATGTRLRRREDRAGMPAIRLFGNVALTLLCRVASGYWSLTDPVNGYTAVTREALEAVRPRSMYEGYGYGVQVLARLHAAGRRAVDVPRRSRYGDEDSGIDYGEYAVRVSWLLAATCLRRLRREHLSEWAPPTPAPTLVRRWRE